MKKKLNTLTVLVIGILFFGYQVNAQTWVSLNSGSSSDLRGVHFPSESIGYAVGTDGTILKTGDAGESWENVTSNYPGYFFWDVNFLDDDFGFVVGESDPGMNPNGIGIILKTTDGGANWAAVFNGNPDPIRDLFVLNKDTIFACGGAEQIDGKIWKSTDSGTTWTQIGNSYIDAFLQGMYFLDSNTGFVGLYESVFGSVNPTSTTWLSTIDGGNSFSSDVIESSIGYWNFSTDFPSPEIGYSSSSTYSNDIVYIRKTTDGGNAWSQNEIPNYMGSLYSLDFVDDNTGYIVGGTSEIGGSPIDVTILKTIDGAVTWNAETCETTNTLHSVHFINPSIGYAVGNAGTILRRTEIIAVDDLNTNQPLKIYPNPSNNLINLSLPDADIAITNIQVLDINGKEVMKRTISEHTVEISQLPQGLYFLKCYTGNEVYGVYKFTKQ